MHTKKIGKNLYQIELDTGGIHQLICSYIISGSNPMIIESGPTNSIPNLLMGIKELEIKPEDIQYIAVTHIHLDHGGGAGTLLKHLSNAKVLVHPRGVQHLTDPERLWSSSQSVLDYVSEVFGKPEPIPKDRVIPITDGSIALDENGELKIIETIGHASHHLSFKETFNGGVFPGDAAGTYMPKYKVVVPTTPPPFILEAALASLDKLITLNPTALYFTHFGKAEDAVNRLKAYKEQLKLWVRIVEDGVNDKLSFEEIQDSIINQDPIMTIVAPYVKDHEIYKKTVLENCIKGIIEYVEQKYTKNQS